VSLRHLIFTVLLFTALTPGHGLADSSRYITVTTQRNVQQAFWMIETDQASVSVILFAGGKGNLKITADGIGKQSNFLVRTRELFAQQGFNVAIIDVPDDRRSLIGFRVLDSHAIDVQAVIHYLRQHYKKPVWLIGTSRGTLSAANIAARLKGDNGPDGIVLTASVVVSKSKDSLHDVELSKIETPSLFVHNKDDGCHVSPFSGVRDVMAMMNRAKDKSLYTVSGGRSEQSNQCRALTPHGFLGLEDEVVKAITSWIKLRL